MKGMPRFVAPLARVPESEERCRACDAPVQHRLRDSIIFGEELAVRCADCLRVYCLRCSWEHFGIKPPGWAKRAERRARVELGRRRARRGTRKPRRRER
jgi:hypothetical protein